MRTQLTPIAERGRIESGPLSSQASDRCNGGFSIACGSERLLVVASDGEGWDHVSVSLPHRCPTWDEMHYVKRQFWRDDETVIQYHPPKHLYLNNHPNCLHMWRPQKAEIPLPPTILVGIKF